MDSAWWNVEQYRILEIKTQSIYHNVIIWKIKNNFLFRKGTIKFLLNIETSKVKKMVLLKNTKYITEIKYYNQDVDFFILCFTSNINFQGDTLHFCDLSNITFYTKIL